MTGAAARTETGDAKMVADAVGGQLGIAEVVAGLLPEDKRVYVQRRVGAGQCVAVVGDVISDAPALIEAQVGGAMGLGTDVALRPRTITVRIPFLDRQVIACILPGA